MNEGDMRIGDAERDDAVAALGEHLAKGRLQPAEHEERSARAVAARTRGELESLFADLPAPHPDLSSAAPVRVRQGRTSKGFQFTVAFALIIALPTAILQWLRLGAWWMFVVVGVLLLLATVVEVARQQRR